MRSALLAVVGLAVVGAMPAADPPDFSPIGPAIEAAINRGEVPGAVVLVVHADKVVYRQAFGSRAVKPEKVPMTPDAVFDLASLTKPLATAASVMTLIEAGKLKPADRVAQHWPAFAANGKGDVTVEQCLLHTTGLTADNAIGDYAGGRAKAFDRIADLRLEAPPGSRFRYSDVGFLVLGELVERVSGKPLDVYAADTLFGPLKMASTGFKTTPAMLARTAPTGTRDGQPIVGVVHDPRALAVGGVAGHAGLFGSADDLGRFARMLLNNGELDGVRVLKPETVAAFVAPHPVPDAPKPPAMPQKLLRSWGWDIDTGFSAPRGETFAKGTGFGHTGFTGTSLWVDPPTGTAVVILTSRLHPDDKGSATPLRRQVGTLVGWAVARR